MGSTNSKPSSCGHTVFTLTCSICMVKHQVQGRKQGQVGRKERRRAGGFMYTIITTGIGHVHVGENSGSRLHEAHNTVVHDTSKHKSYYTESIKKKSKEKNHQGHILSNNLWPRENRPMLPSSGQSTHFNSSSI
ncbi:hypothetical protein JOB18_049616 [Solea senegalensis]|uniref:Uncharacterized protein n=1 Tax=Solea senegalensis TaxID=28829 RepID=A0AAV6RTD8_SOLSE|nr:hypothetical protein JOB18_049616 [Solea senegalensis]KAG7507943.1 hypothetical protein JOB18_049616 [Solea senegalensis]